jgi:hypothetical protein
MASSLNGKAIALLLAPQDVAQVDTSYPLVSSRKPDDVPVFCHSFGEGIRKEFAKNKS